MPAISGPNPGSVAPAWKMRLAIIPASNAPWASSNGEKARPIAVRNPRPAQRSGCVGTRWRSMRDTRHRKRAKTNRRKYQRSSRNWNIGRLTPTAHQPAGDSASTPPGRSPNQLVTSSATSVRQTNGTPIP